MLRRIPDVELKDGGRVVAYEELWREGFVGFALTFRLDPRGLVTSIELYTTKWVALWEPGRGISARGWQEAGRWFPIEVLNGPTSLPPGALDELRRHLRETDARLADFIDRALGASTALTFPRELLDRR